MKNNMISFAKLSALMLAFLVTSKLLAQQPDAFEVGDKIPDDVFVVDASGENRKLLDLVKPETKVIYLLVFGGPSMSDRTHGGLWCEDSFNDLPTSNYIRLKYEDSGVEVVPVVCPPVYHEDLFAFEEDAFLKSRQNSEKYQDNFKTFVNATKALQTLETIPFKAVFFDPRFQLMLNHKKTTVNSEYAGKKLSWLGKFKPQDDTQTYSTPTIWLLSKDGEVLHAPFFGNRYNPTTQKIVYTVLDVERAVLEALVKASE